MTKDTDKLEKVLVQLKEKYAYMNQTVYEEMQRCLIQKHQRYVLDIEKLVNDQILRKKEVNCCAIIKNDFLKQTNMWERFIKDVESLQKGEKSDLTVKKVEIRQAINQKKRKKRIKNKRNLLIF